MPPARGRARGGRGRKSPKVASPARATRASSRLKPADDPSLASEEQNVAEVEKMEDEAVADTETAEPSVLDVSNENKSEAADESEVTDSQNESFCEADSEAVLSGAEISIGVRETDTLGSSGEVNAEDDDIQIVTESEGAADEGTETSFGENQNDAGVCESLTLNEQKAEEDEALDDVQVTKVENLNTELVEVDASETNQSEQPDYAADVSEGDASGACQGENEMDTSTADDSIVMVDSDRIEDDIDDMIVIDEGDDDEEENKTDAEQKEISRETHDSGTKHDSAVGTSAGVKHEEAATGTSVQHEDSATSATASVKNEEKDNKDKKKSQSKSQEKKTRESMSQETSKIKKADYIWQVRVFPVNLEDMREQKETWNDLCNMAVMAEYRKTKGVITRGQVNLEQTKSGMFQFLVKRALLQPMLRQLMCCRFSLTQLRIEMRRLTLNAYRDVKFDTQVLHGVLGEMMYNKEGNEREKAASFASQARKASSAETRSDLACVRSEPSLETEKTKKLQSCSPQTVPAKADENMVVTDGAENAPETQDKVSSSSQEGDTGDQHGVKDDTESVRKLTKDLSSEAQVSSQEDVEKTEDESVKMKSEHSSSGGASAAEPQTASVSADHSNAGEKHTDEKKSSEEGKVVEGAAKSAHDVEVHAVSEQQRKIIIAREDAVSFRIHLVHPREGLRHLRDGLRSARKGKVREECQLFLTNLSNSVCDDTVAAIFPFARFLKRTNRDDHVGKAIFQTASSLETEKYLDAYHKISVDCKPVHIASAKVASSDHRIRQEKIHRELNPLKRKRGPQRKQSGSQVADANAGQKRPRQGRISSGTAAKRPRTSAGSIMKKPVPLMGGKSGGPQRSDALICHKCHEAGHKARNCPMNLTGAKTPGLQCRNCLQEGHFSCDCPLPQQRKGNVVQQAQEGARQLEELYARVAETQRNLSFLQQQAQMAETRVMGDGSFPPQAHPGANFGSGNMPANMPGNLPGNMPGNMAGNMPGNFPGNMAGNMSSGGPSFGGPGGFAGGQLGVMSQMPMNMGVPFGNMMGGRDFHQATGNMQGQQPQGPGNVDNSFPCRICGQLYKTKASVRKHLRGAHPLQKGTTNPAGNTDAKKNVMWHQQQRQLVYIKNTK